MIIKFTEILQQKQNINILNQKKYDIFLTF